MSILVNSPEMIVKIANLALRRFEDEYRVNLTALNSNGRLVVRAAKVCSEDESFENVLNHLHFIVQTIKGAITGVGGWPMRDSELRDITHAKPFDNTAECEIVIGDIADVAVSRGNNEVMATGDEA